MNRLQDCSELPREATFMPHGASAAHVATLEAIEYNRFSDSDMERFITIANQPLVRKWMIDDLVGYGQLFDRVAAKHEISEGERDWQTGHGFQYIVRDQAHDIKGTVTLHASVMKHGSISYWFDTRGESGYATDAVIALGCLAAAAGYERLTAKVRKPNKRSIGLVERAGFTFIEYRPLPDNNYYEKLLIPNRTTE